LADREFLHCAWRVGPADPAPFGEFHWGSLARYRIASGPDILEKIRMRWRDLPVVMRWGRNKRFEFRRLAIWEVAGITGQSPIESSSPGLLLYSLSILSAHSTNATKSGGATKQAFLLSRSMSRTARAREHAVQMLSGIL
jgi:hypothetical protein